MCACIFNFSRSLKALGPLLTDVLNSCQTFTRNCIIDYSHFKSLVVIVLIFTLSPLSTYLDDVNEEETTSYFLLLFVTPCSSGRSAEITLCSSRTRADNLPVTGIWTSFRIFCSASLSWLPLLRSNFWLCCSPFQGLLFLSQFHTDVSISLTVSAEDSAEDLGCSSPLGDEHVGIGLSLKASSSINWNVFQFL